MRNRSLKMKKLLMICISMAIVTSGCASKQTCAKVPETACMQCAIQMRESGQEAVTFGTMAAINATGSFFTFLQSSEKFLQNKIEEWKVTHPELVVDGEKQLSSLRAKMSEYKERAKNSVKEAW
jgi:hypothetical protein